MKKNRYTIKQRKLLKKKAWVVFSLYIRKRDNYTCITCGKKSPDVSIHSGHFCHNREDFNPMNINAQCMGCNWRKKGNMRIYTLYMVNKYGFDTVVNLMKCEKEKARLESAEFYLDIIKKYS